MMKYDKRRTGYQICTRCVMDTSDVDIIFDKDGFCNHCNGYFKRENEFLVGGEKGQRILESKIRAIKKSQRDKKRDCLLGMSGGVDSSYTAYLAKKHGLRVLLFHFDNGWDTEEAQRNINRIAEYTGFELHTCRANSDEFADLQCAYFKSSVVDIEVTTDHAIAAAVHKFAEENEIKYILTGANYVTEGILPPSWSYLKMDLRNLRAIHEKYGRIPLKAFPTMGYFKWLYYLFIKGMTFVRLLDYSDYNVEEAKKVLSEELGWENYGLKHCESLFTKFYQCHILPTKFNIDKRRPHFSTLICSGQITRQQAIEELNKSLYEQHELESTIDRVLETWRISREEYDHIMSLPRVEHNTFDTGAHTFYVLRFIKILLGKVGWRI